MICILCVQVFVVVHVRQMSYCSYNMDKIKINKNLAGKVEFLHEYIHKW